MTPEGLVALAERRSPGAVALAELASVAGTVEPALLRRLRFDVESQLTSAAEGDLWLGPLVESRSALGFTLRADVVPILRARLAQRPERLAAARAAVERAHADAPRSVQIEEEIVWRALRPDTAVQGPEIDAALRSAVKAMVVESGRAKDVARWAVRMLPRLPPSVRDSVAAWTLALGAGARLDGRPVLPGDAPDGAIEDIRGLLPDTGDATEIGLRLLRDRLEVSEPPDPRSERVSVRRTNPLLVSVAGPDGVAPRQLSLRPGETRTIDVHSPRTDVEATDGASWSIEAPAPDVTLVLYESGPPTAGVPADSAASRVIVAPLPIAGEQSQGFRLDLLGKIARAAAPSDLLGVGEQLARLLPGELWKALDELSSDPSRVPTVLVVSDVDLPWELATMPNPRRGDLPPFLGIHVALGSWVSGGPDAPPILPDPVAVDVDVIGVLAPQTSRRPSKVALPRDGAGLLRDEYGAMDIEPTPAEIRSWLSPRYRPGMIHVRGAALDAGGAQGTVLWPGEGFGVSARGADIARLDGSMIVIEGDDSKWASGSLDDLSRIAAGLVTAGAAGVLAPAVPTGPRWTSAVMRGFYPSVLAEHVPPAEALRSFREANIDGIGGTIIAALSYRYFGHPGTRLRRRPSATVWDGEAGAVVGRLVGHEDEVTAVAWAPDGSRLVTGSRDGTVRWWAASCRFGGLVARSSAPVTAIALSPDGARVAVATEDGSLTIWTPGVERPAAVATRPLPEVAIAWSPAGDRIAAVTPDAVSVVDARSGEIVALSAASAGLLPFVAWPAANVLVVQEAYGELFTLDAASPTQRLAGAGTLQPVSAAAASADGALIATGSSDGAILVWEAATGKVVTSIPGERTGDSVIVALTIIDTELRSLSWAGRIERWDLTGGSSLGTMAATIPAGGAAFSADGRHLVTWPIHPRRFTAPGDSGSSAPLPFEESTEAMAEAEADELAPS